MGIFASLWKTVIGDANQRKLKSVEHIIKKINAIEEDYTKCVDEELQQKTLDLKARLDRGETLDDILPEAFANVREAARRAIGLRAFDTQLVGAVLLHKGNITEMKTGEGKTLVATFPAYLNALAGRGVHIVTVNEYLAKRDADWMGKVYNMLGLRVDVVYSQQPDDEKKIAYEADITYATNNELGFDYLRDNMRVSLDNMHQRAHAYAIVDEVDSILIDEARTPLIISGPAQDRGDLYKKINKIIPDFRDVHITIDEKRRSIVLSDLGNDFAEEKLRKVGFLDEKTSLYDPDATTLVHHLTQGLLAHKLYTRDKDYIVNDNKIILIDEFTGRMMDGRRLSDGLHQALEAKENVEIQGENTTLASITFQNYFRMYDKLAGMTGTAETEAQEFGEIYGLGVVVIPTHLPVVRQDEDDAIFRTAKEKYVAVVENVVEAHEKGQPVLVGTTSIEKSEMLSKMLKKAKVAHNVLNARQHTKEARIIAEAGRLGAVTIATNMAGRGTDIQLGGNVEQRFEDYLAKHAKVDAKKARTHIIAEVEDEKAKVIAAGGLYVLATERHESRRIDNQLRGRSGRQGDPGKTSFFLSLEDDLMRIFGSERLDKLLSTLGMKEGEAVTHPWVNKSLEKAQAKVEARNFDIRKQLLKFDDVMNDQRRVIFSQRREVMSSDDISAMIKDMRQNYVEDLVAEFLPENTYPEQWDVDGLEQAVREDFLLELPVGDWAAEEGVDDEEIIVRLCTATNKQMDEKSTLFGSDSFRNIEKQLLLEIIDRKWREHLLMLEHLRAVVGFRGYAQRDPLNEYKSEAFQLFEVLLEGLRKEITTILAKIRPMSEQEQKMALLKAQAMSEKRINDASKARHSQNRDVSDMQVRASRGKISRNQPCPCGSGKKYKHCHGKLG